MKLLFTLLIYFFNTPAHEFKIGRYEIRPNEGDMTLFVRLDRYDIMEAIQTQTSCGNPDILDVCLTEYIVNHVKLTFDGKEACYEYQEHEVKEEFIEMYFRIGIDPEGVKEIKVFNNALLEQWIKQENIVYSLLNDRSRSFRLNKDRTETLIVY